MKKALPKVHFEELRNLKIEVMNFERLSGKLDFIKDHNPYAPHKIEFYLILLVTKGVYTHFVDFKSYELSVGSILFIAQSQVHHFNKELRDANGYGIVFSHSFVDKHYFLNDSLRLNRLFNYHIESPLIHQEQMGEDDLLQLVSTLAHEYSLSNNFAKSEILATLLRVLLLKAERAKELQSLTRINRRWMETFNNFRKTLEQEYVNTRSSRAYAAKLFVSYKFLNDVVKKLTGKTVKAFIDDFVTMEIKRYLISTALSIKEISYKTGFEESANMIKFFKKNTSVTPLKFRQEL